MKDRYALCLENLGFKAYGETTLENRSARVFRLDTLDFEVVVEDNGTARLTKPNGTVKWVYEKTAAQLRRICEQSISFYTWRN